MLLVVVSGGGTNHLVHLRRLRALPISDEEADAGGAIRRLPLCRSPARHSAPCRDLRLQIAQVTNEIGGGDNAPQFAIVMDDQYRVGLAVGQHLSRFLDGRGRR